MHRVVARWWMLVAVLDVAVAGFCVSRLQGIFGSDHNTAPTSNGRFALFSGDIVGKIAFQQTISESPEEQTAPIIMGKGGIRSNKAISS